MRDQAVDPRVGGGVRALPGSAQQRGGRGEGQPPVDVARGGGHMKPPAAGDLRGEHSPSGGIGHVQHDLVGENHRAVHHPGQPEPGVFDRPHQPLGGVWLGDVAGDHLDPATGGVQLRDSGCHLVAGGRASVEDNQSRTLLSQPARDDESETTHTADDEVAAVAADQRKWWRGSDRLDAAVLGYRDDDLAGVFTGCHKPECVGRIVQAKCGDGKYLEFAIRHVLQDVLQELAVARRLQLEIQVEVDHGEGRALG